MTYVPVPELDEFVQRHPLCYPGGQPVKVGDSVWWKVDPDEPDEFSVEVEFEVLAIRGDRVLVSSDPEDPYRTCSADPGALRFARHAKTEAQP